MENWRTELPATADTAGMPRKPAPLVVEIVYSNDEAEDTEARIAAIDLLIDFILEDRALAAEPAKVDTLRTA